MSLKAVLLNCTLKKSPEESNTQALMDIVIGHLESLDVSSETVRVVDYNVPFGVASDKGDGDQWPQILDKIMAADILIIGTSIWFGVRNSVCQMVIERLDGTYTTPTTSASTRCTTRSAGVVVTGNEDGAHAAAETTLFNMTHLGFTIPPNADTYWVGDAGPGPSFIEAGGQDHAYTQKTASWMAHNVVHLARILKGTRSRPRATRSPPTETRTREQEPTR